MVIQELKCNQVPDHVLTDPDYHFVTVSEHGFSVLDSWVSTDNYYEGEQTFAITCNKKNEVASLFPDIPVSVIPRNVFRRKQVDSSGNCNELRRHICDFLTLNEEKIKARKVLFEFHIAHKPVSEYFVNICKEELSNVSHLVDEAIIVVGEVPWSKEVSSF